MKVRKKKRKEMAKKKEKEERGDERFLIGEPE
jgi:hypothetical protein